MSPDLDPPKPHSLRTALSLAALLLFCSACGGLAQEPDQEPTPNPLSRLEAQTALPTIPAETPLLSGLGPDPQNLEFSARDGTRLSGTFFPSRYHQAPVVVLMHWYPGDQSEWREIAFWLQNRGQRGQSDGVPWLDPAWFPTLPSGASYNVLTFNFRDCQGGCQAFHPVEWALDARSGLEYAQTLEGVDPERIIALGASIGGDGAIAGCAAALAEDPRACLGALSLSPGNYLGESYRELVAALGANLPPRPAWCLYDLDDPDAWVCREASGKNYYQEGWSGGNLHGLHLLTSTLDPLPLARIVEFLESVQ